jgi:hypothetical protein
MRAPSAMSVDQVNYLNVGLILLSCALAYVIPFELFLLAYAILGPAHYLTEISWLHTRGYFTRGKGDYLVLGALCVVLMLVYYGALAEDRMGWGTTVMFVAFSSAFAMAFSARPWVKAGVVACGFLVGRAVADLETSQIVLLTFVPTIVHVYVFTAIFMLYGALKGRSRSGLLSIAVFAACTVAVFAYVPSGRDAPLAGYVEAAYQPFADVNVNLADWLGTTALAGLHDVFYSKTGVMLMRFIAFAYTYHYLNWFSKTSVIQWHKIPKPWAIANVVLWVASVGLYAYDYSAGLMVLVSLSFLHVLLEFPLNHVSFVGVGRELRTVTRDGWATRAPAH